MSDIYLGLAISALLSVFLFLLCARLSSRISGRLSNLLALASLLFLLLYIRDLWNSQLLSRVLPYSNLIVVGNWLTLSVSTLGGLAWSRIPGLFYRKTLYVGTLMGVAAYSLVHPILGSVPKCRDEWKNGVCRQSTMATCSPASAATLLKWYGISTNEQEMAELCLTRKEGTHWQGLFRGLKLKTEGTPWTVEWFSADSFEVLRQKTSQGPVILSVGLPRNTRSDSLYIRDWGWLPGVSHSVVLFSFLEPDMVRIGDPSVDDGKENWTNSDLSVLWQGRGMRLVARDPMLTASRKLHD